MTPQEAFNRYLQPYTKQGKYNNNIEYVKKDPERLAEWKDRNAKALLWRTAQEQYDMDMAMWYGALSSPGTQGKGAALKRILTVAHFGGLFYKRNSQWKPWASSGIPVCSALSHRGRIMVQLPFRGEREDGKEFFNWLSGGEIIGRKAATHGISRLKTGQHLRLGGTKFKKLKETKFAIAGHYGMNVGMGGVGNRNPVSLNTINTNGGHGHVYVYLLKPKRQGVGGVLIALEPSAPPGGGETKDQYGDAHGLGSGQTIQATGGLNWQNLTWVHNGPNDAKNLDNKIIDLTEGWEFLRDRNFTADMLDQTGVSPLEQPVQVVPQEDIRDSPLLTSTYLTETNMALAERIAKRASELELTQISSIIIAGQGFNRYKSAFVVSPNADPMVKSKWENASSVSWTKGGSRKRILPVDSAYDELSKTTKNYTGGLRAQLISLSGGALLFQKKQNVKHRLTKLNALQQRIAAYSTSVSQGSKSGRLHAVYALALLVSCEKDVLTRIQTALQ